MIKEVKSTEVICDCCGLTIKENIMIGFQSISRTYITLGDFHVCSTCASTVLKKIWEAKGSEINLKEIISKSQCYVPRTFDGGIIKGFL